mmetsp:Transcript_8445/g.26264  ORF Transcript_8445/g.26264 Transcript_8445/m.26264 type:complete len:263 (+) Transcript_8445:972-1760(+)
MPQGGRSLLGLVLQPELLGRHRGPGRRGDAAEPRPAGGAPAQQGGGLRRRSQDAGQPLQLRHHAARGAPRPLLAVERGVQGQRPHAHRLLGLGGRDQGQGGLRRAVPRRRAEHRAGDVHAPPAHEGRVRAVALRLLLRPPALQPAGGGPQHGHHGLRVCGAVCRLAVLLQRREYTRSPSCGDDDHQGGGYPRQPFAGHENGRARVQAGGEQALAADAEAQALPRGVAGEALLQARKKKRAPGDRHLGEDDHQARFSPRPWLR